MPDFIVFFAFCDKADFDGAKKSAAHSDSEQELLKFLVACRDVDHVEISRKIFRDIALRRSENNRYIFFNSAYTSVAVPITIGVIIKVFGKELAKVIEIVQQADKKVGQSRTKLMADSEKLHARAKRELSVARRNCGSANVRASKRQGLRWKPGLTPTVCNKWKCVKEAISGVEAGNCLLSGCC